MDRRRDGKLVVPAEASTGFVPLGDRRRTAIYASPAAAILKRGGEACVEFVAREWRRAGERLRMAKPKPKPRSLVIARVKVCGRDRTRLRDLREDVISLGREPLARLNLIAFG